MTTPDIRHQHLIVRAEIQAPPMNRTALDRVLRRAERRVARWMRDLIRDMDMKVMFGPRAEYCYNVGNRGLTAFAIIETSHLALHVWDECDPGVLQFDVYTCSCLDIEMVIKSLDVFRPTRIEYKFLDREHELIMVREDASARGVPVFLVHEHPNAA